jgi:adenosine kinase
MAGLDRKIYVCGSISFDTIIKHDGRLSDEINSLWSTGMNLEAATIHKHRGGCCGNIVYNLCRINNKTVAVASVGSDAHSYIDAMVSDGVETSNIKIIEDLYTAQAYIITDKVGNQITSFHPGAMQESGKIQIEEVGNGDIAIISPDSKKGIIKNVEYFYKNRVSFMYDPGQSIPLFSKEALLSIIKKCTWMTLNSYELELILNKTELKIEELILKVNTLIVTNGKHGSKIYNSGNEIYIDAIAINNAIDPTGCGDAYRAGLLYGIYHNLDWETTGRISGIMGSIKVKSMGGQNHTIGIKEIKIVYIEEYGCDWN